MVTSLNLNLKLDWEIIPESEGTTDEIIPARVNIKKVFVIGDGKEIDITEVIHPEEIEILESEIIQEQGL